MTHPLTRALKTRTRVRTVGGLLRPFRPNLNAGDRVRLSWTY